MIITQVVPSHTLVDNLHIEQLPFYYNVEVEVPGCHDRFGGVIGALYQCQLRGGRARRCAHADASTDASASGRRCRRRTSFQWDAAHEEAYRLWHLTDTSRNYLPGARCFEAHHFGAPLHNALAK